MTIKLPALNPGWEPISPRLVAEIGNAADRELETEDKPSWPWAVSGLGTVMNNVEGAPGSETTTSADLDAASLGIEIRSDRASDPMEFASLSLRTSHGGIRLTNVAWLASVNEVPVVLAQATRGSLVVDGLSAAADPAAFGDIRGQLSFWTKEGDAKVSRVRVSVSQIRCLSCSTTHSAERHLPMRCTQILHSFEILRCNFAVWFVCVLSPGTDAH